MMYGKRWVNPAMTFLLICSSALTLRAQQLAFPGAEGGGRFAWGGRGGRVIEVTNLNDDGLPGSLRYAINQTGARTVVFRISGTIPLVQALKITKDSITIAGQTAPGDGICLKNFTFNVSANEVIIRFIRSRFGDQGAGKPIDDAINGYNSTPHAKKNIIVDHCSASWSLDESLSFYGYDSLTIQWCLISESLYNSYDPKGTHGYGGIWGGFNSTFHHNLLAHHSSRNPRFSGPTPAGSGTVYSQNLDFRNNVIYNWGFNSSYGGEESEINIIDNYYKYGPATKSSVKGRIFNPYGAGDSTGTFYIDSNYVDGDTAVTNDNWKGVTPQYSGFRMSTAVATSPFPFPSVTTNTPQEAYALVLANAGATLPKRDTIDKRIVFEVANRTATYSGHTHVYEKSNGLDTTVPHGIIDSQSDVGGWPTLNSLPPPSDSDHDGMPDAWEIAHGLNPYDASDRNIVDGSGYTKLEEYLDELAGAPTSVATERSIEPTKFDLLQNYPNPFNPTTTVVYSLSMKARAVLEIFDIVGRRVATMDQGVCAPGEYSVVIHADHWASGIYFCKLTAGEEHKTIKLVLMR
ncbi:MAG TPA: T9SS type A sorting domain-containing protein [Bacteroidota bacterium]|nr:T9SS type A sorting domain-containing protein [Bacteroidota bacterium]